MPFTLTHTLAVVPVAKRWPQLPVAALLIGAMVPDWGLFVPFGPHYSSTHTVSGLLTACLPLGLLLFMLFRSLYRRALIELTPSWLQSRLRKFNHWQNRYSPLELLLAAAALLLGAATHLVWDAFTHHGRWGVELLPLLKQATFQLGGRAVQAYELLQHGSSLIGLPLLALLCWRWLMRQPCDLAARPLLNAQARVVLVGAIAGMPTALIASQLLGQLETLSVQWLHDAAFMFVTQVGFLSFAVFNVYCVALRLLSLRPRAELFQRADA